MIINEVSPNFTTSKMILNESWQSLNEHQRNHIGRWERNIWPLVESFSRLMEANLSSEQIKQIFQNAEDVAIQNGNNTNALGKAGKVTSEVGAKIKNELNNLMDQAQDSGPVKNMDQKFEQLKRVIKQNIGNINGGSSILAAILKWKDFANENPIKSAFVIGAMTAVGAFLSGGVVSGAAIGFFVKLANNTIKGDKLSTAAAKSAKGAAIGAVAGGISDFFSDQGVEGLKNSSEEEIKAFEESLENPETEERIEDYHSDIQELNDVIINTFGEGSARIASQFEVNGSRFYFDAVMSSDEYSEYKNLDGAIDKIEFLHEITEDSSHAAKLELWENVVDKISDAEKNIEISQEYQEQLDNLNQELVDVESNNWDKKLEVYQKYADLIDSLAQGTATAASGNKSKTRESVDLWDNFLLYEAGFKDIVKNAKRSAENISRASGKELTNKITTKKLIRQWKKAGSPTDAGSIANILKSNGLSDEQIGLIASDNDIDLTSKAAKRSPQTQNSTDDQNQEQNDPSVGGQDNPGDQEPSSSRSEDNPQLDTSKIQKIADRIKEQNLEDIAKEYIKSTQKEPEGDSIQAARDIVRAAHGGDAPISPAAKRVIKSGLRKMAAGDRNAAITVARSIRKLAKAGADVSKARSEWGKHAKKGRLFVERKRFHEIAKMLSESGVTWRDVGITLLLSESNTDGYCVEFIEEDSKEIPEGLGRSYDLTQYKRTYMGGGEV